MKRQDTLSAAWAFRTVEKKINIISVAMDAPQDLISALSGSIGRLRGVSTKTAYSNIITDLEQSDHA